MIEDGINGFVCEPDARALAYAIERYLSSPAEEQRRMQQAALLRAEGFTWRTHVARYEAVLESLVGPDKAVRKAA
jgi:glycosyltransferase involved in cell wall biosynthesis